MINRELIKNKMNDIQGYLQELSPLLKEESREVIENNLKLHTVERLFQLIVDTSIDINTHIITQLSLQVPDDYQSTFTTLAQSKVVRMDFALKIGPAVGLRNLVVHKYGKVDIKRMVEDIKNNIGDFVEYLKQIDIYLQKILCS